MKPLKRFKVSAALHVTCELSVRAEDEQAAMIEFHNRFRENERPRLRGVRFHLIDAEELSVEELDD